MATRANKSLSELKAEVSAFLESVEADAQSPEVRDRAARCCEIVRTHFPDGSISGEKAGRVEVAVRLSELPGNMMQIAAVCQGPRQDLHGRMASRIVSGIRKHLKGR